MKNTKHTPTPWSVNTTSFSGAIVRFHIAGPVHGSCYPICEHILEEKPDATQQLEDAAHIVRCVNSHDELLAALKLMVEVGCDLYDMDMGDNGAPALDKARAAISKAESQ